MALNTWKCNHLTPLRFKLLSVAPFWGRDVFTVTLTARRRTTHNHGIGNCDRLPVVSKRLDGQKSTAGMCYVWEFGSQNMGCKRTEPQTLLESSAIFIEARVYLREPSQVVDDTEWSYCSLVVDSTWQSLWQTTTYASRAFSATDVVVLFNVCRLQCAWTNAQYELLFLVISTPALLSINCLSVVFCI